MRLYSWNVNGIRAVLAKGALQVKRLHLLVLSKTLPTDYGRVLENVVYLELLRRYDKVLVGKNDTKEVDFVAMVDDEAHYYQVALTVRDDATRQREIDAFPSDHHAKFLLTLDPEEGNIHGIKQLNALNWLVKGV